MSFTFGSPNTTSGNTFGTTTPSTGFAFASGDAQKSLFGGGANADPKRSFSFNSPTTTASAFGSSTFAFGGAKTTAATSSLFSTPTTSTSTFGTNKPVSFGGFSSPPNQTVGGPGFGQPANQNTGQNVAFGATTQSQNPPAFGTPAASTGLFGSTGSSFAFGKPATTTAAFPFATPTSGFSTAQQPAATPASAFGATTTTASAPSGPQSNLFNSKAPGFGFGTSVFGANTTSTAPATPASGFGQPNTNFAAPTTAQPTAGLAFGATTSQTTTGLGFGTTSTQPSAGLSFGTTTQATTGSSFGTTTTQAATGLGFGTSTTQATTGLGFGATATQATTGLNFGATTTQSTSGLGFGTSSTPASTGLSFGATTAPASTGLNFGASTTPAPTGLSFGAISSTQAPSSIPSFGATSTTSATSTLAFGTTAPTQATSNLAFGTTAQAPTAHSAGQTSQATGGIAFGSALSSQAPSTLTFGATTQSTVPSFGTATSTQPTTTGLTLSTPIATTQQTVPGFGVNQVQSSAGLSFGTATTTPASTGLNFGTSTSTGLSFGKATTTSAATSFQLGKTPTTSVGFGMPSSATSQPSSTEAEAATTARLRKLRATDDGPSKPRRTRRHRRGALREDGLLQAARKMNDLAVTIRREDGLPISEVLGSIVRSKLRALIEKAIDEEVDSKKLSFATSELVEEGFFLVTPMTEEARDWLVNECDFGEYEGVPIRAKKLDRFRVLVWLPGKKKDLPADPLKWLKSQNRHKKKLNIAEWSLISRKYFPAGVRLIVGIPRGNAAHWEKHVWLNFEATQVCARMLQPKRSNTLCVIAESTTHDTCSSQDNGSLKVACPNCGCTCQWMKIAPQTDAQVVQMDFSAPNNVTDYQRRQSQEEDWNFTSDQHMLNDEEPIRPKENPTKKTRH